ncbi:MAG: tetratricopeptide repeat protein [Nevskia sp.]|nr:tetratricopeptide repeat protein [Nevskia sp.]
MKRAALAAACLALAACQTEAVKHAAPPIKTLENVKQPAPDKLPIIQSEPVAADPEKALENYRKLLELSADPDTRAEAMKRIADLQLQVEDTAGNTSNGAALKDSIRIYKELLQSPNAKDSDRVLYQLARAYQNSGETDQAIVTLQRLEHDYPTSPLIADAHFRAGELMYGRSRYAEAEQEYGMVMALGEETPFFVPAQYKYGWSQFQQQKYADDVAVFFAILDRELPPGEPDDPEATLKAVPVGKADLARDALRVSSLSFGQMGGGKAVNQYFAQHGEPRFYPLVYSALGELMLDKRRYTDAANAYAAFVESHAMHPRAPQFQSHVISAYQDGGFSDLVVREKERYATAYEPASAYWGGKQPTPEVMTELRRHLEDLGRHYQAKAQQDPPADAATKRADFVAAAGWYRKILDIYPQDPKLPEINMLYADSLYDGGQTKDAAEQYLKTAYGYPNNPRAPEAAYAAVQAYQRLGKEVTPADRPAVLRQSVDASVKLADTFPTHPQWAPVLTRAAQDLYEVKDLDQAITLANRVLAANPPPPVALRSQVLAVLADSKFAQGKYAEAEAAYTQLLALTPAADPAHKTVVEQLAASIYKQGDAARTAGDLRTAARHFLRVGQVTPDASIRPNADYDAAAAFFSLQDWGATEQTLEGFRARFPTNSLIADADKKLALAYQKDNKPAQAATAYLRVSQRTSESEDTRREAGWLAATLYDQAKLPDLAASTYEYYVRNFPQPLDRGIQARRRLADMALANNDRPRYLAWLRDLVAADDMAGSARTDDSKLAAAQASLELGRAAAQDAQSLSIDLPIAKSLPVRKKATEAAVQALNRAASYGFIDTTTAATFETGNVYHDFSRALLNSERPPKLKGDELEQYNLLLEEQAEPFDELAIKAHEANLQRVAQGLWNPSIRKSVDALGQLAPAQYGKREQREEIYETLR